MCIAISAVLALYASGRGCELILDSGEGVTHTVLIHQGFFMPHAVSRLDLSGHDLTKYLVTILKERGYSFESTGERDSVRDIKDELCYVPLDFAQEIEAAECSSSKERQFLLPDESSIVMGSECFRCPEILFQPSLAGKEMAGIHQMVFTSIMKYDIDLRKDFFCNVVLYGGTTMLPGIVERITREVTTMAPQSVRVNVISPPERKYSTWIGGSILSFLPTFQNSWISRRDFYDLGPIVVHQKCPGQIVGHVSTEPMYSWCSAITRSTCWCHVLIVF